MLLALLATVAMAHDYILDTLPETLSGTPVVGIVANNAERERRLDRPDTLARLDHVTAAGTKAVRKGRGWGVVSPTDDAVDAVVYENTGATIEFPFDKFRHYVANEGDARQLSVLDGLPKTPQKEHYRRSLKLLLGLESGAAGWERVVGLLLELVPLDRPGSTRTMRVKLLEGGAPAVNAVVRAYPIKGHMDDDGVSARTDENGVATLNLPSASLDWVFAAVTMTYDSARPEPWHSIWTTLRTR